MFNYKYKRKIEEDKNKIRIKLTKKSLLRIKDVMLVVLIRLRTLLRKSFVEGLDHKWSDSSYICDFAFFFFLFKDMGYWIIGSTRVFFHLTKSAGQVILSGSVK